MCCYQVTVIKVGDCHRSAGSTLRPGRERMACHRLVQRCLHDDHHPDRTTEPQVHALRPATDQGLGPSAVPVASRHPASAPWDRHHDAADSAGWLSLQVPHPRRDRGCGLFPCCIRRLRPFTRCSRTSQTTRAVPHATYSRFGRCVRRQRQWTLGRFRRHWRRLVKSGR